MKRISRGGLIAALALIPLVSHAQISGKTDQYITFDSLTGICSLSSRAIIASASSGLPVSFSSSNPSIVTIEGNLVIALAAGTVTITALQPGNETFNPAPDVSRTLTVFAVPGVFSSDNTTICSGEATNISLYSDFGGTTFFWSVQSANNVTGAMAGSGEVLNQTLFNNSLLADSVIYRVTPVANGCNGDSIDVKVTVRPIPQVTLTDTIICSGTPVNIPIVSNLPETSFTWTVQSAVNVSNATSGGGQTITQTLTNITSSTGTVLYAVTPLTDGCAGNAGPLTVTVNPLPVVSAPGRNICSGQRTAVPLTSNVSGTSFTWQVPAIVNVTGATAGEGNLIDQTLINNSLNSGYAIYAITPLANGCPGLTQNVTVNVLPVPAATVADGAICSGQQSNVSLSSTIPGTVFSWIVQSVTNVAGAFPAVGTTTINQTLTNSTTLTGTVVYTITPSANSCLGASVDATVTVKPLPSVIAAGKTICSGQATGIALLSNIPETTFSWEVQSALNVTGASSGSGSSINQTLNNDSFSVGNAVYSVTPFLNGCNGPSSNISVIVNALPQVSASNQSICSGQNTDISLVSTLPSTSFSWVAQNVNNISGATSGNGQIISQTLTTILPSIGSVTYNITPVANGCTGATGNVLVDVSPPANVSAVNQTICSGQTANISLSSDTEATTFSWIVQSALNVSGATSGSGTIISNTLTLSSLVPSVVVYRVTPSNGCGIGLFRDVIVTVDNCAADALSFDNDYVSIPYQPNGRLNLGTGSFVMEVYVKASVTSGIRTFLSKRTYVTGSSSDGFLFGTWSDGRPFIQLEGAPNILPPPGSANIYDGNCHHVAVRRNGKILSFFVDGVFIGNGDHPSNRDISTSGTLRIGSDPVTNGNYFNGWIGEIRVWNTPLTNEQISLNAGNNLSPQEGLVGYYDLNDGPENQVLTDLSSIIPTSQNNGFLGNSLLADGFDPAWLMSSQITCSFEGNFRTRDSEDDDNGAAPDSTRHAPEITQQMQTYPSPADEFLTVSIPPDLMPGAVLNMIDRYGVEVRNTDIQAGEEFKTLHTGDLAAGVYIVQIESIPGMLIRKKVLIIHP